MLLFSKNSPSLFSSSAKGAIFAILAALSLSTSMSITKTLSPDTPTSLVVFIRTLFGLIFFLPFFIRNHQQIFKTKQRPWHLLRVITTIFAMLCTYYTYRHLPLGFATSLGMTGPLFTTLISILFLKEHIHKYTWIFLIIGYLGALLIIKPHQMTLDIAIIASLLANVLAGCSLVLTKILSKHDSTTTIMGYGNLGIFIGASILNFNGWQMVGFSDLIRLAIIAMLGLCTQYCSIVAVQQTSPSFIAPFDYTRLLFSFLIGFFIFNELPDSYTVIGSLIIMGSTYIIVRQKNLKT